MVITRRGTLAKAGWFDYPDGPEFKDPLELKKAVRLMPTIPLIPFHPDEMFAQDADTVIGVGYNEYNPQKQQIDTVFNFFEDRLTPSQSQAVRTRQIDVSPGFTCKPRPFGHGHKQASVLLNHGAVLFEGQGRCSIQQGCGVMDEEKRVDRTGPAIRMDPFAGYETFEACVKAQMDKGKDEESAKAICGKLQSEAHGDAVLAVKSGKTKADGSPHTRKIGEKASMTDEKTTTELEDRLKVLEEKLARIDSLEAYLAPMEEALRKSLVKTGRFTEDELKEKSYPELQWLKAKFETDAPEAKGDTTLPPAGGPTTSKELKTQGVGNKRYKYQELLSDRHGVELDG